MTRPSAVRPVIAVCLGAAAGSYGLAAGWAALAQTSTGARPPFEKLIEYNASELFGGKLELLGEDRFRVTYDMEGQAAKGFEGPGIHDAKSPAIQGANKKFIMKDKDKVHPGLACVGIAPPDKGWSVWTSRFPVAGDVRVKFDFRIPNLLTQQSSFFARLNVEGKKYLETKFFQTAEKHAHDQLLARSETTLKDYSGPPGKWVPRKGDPIPVELAAEGGKFTVSFQNKELVKLDKISDVPRGKVVFGFRKIVFTMQNLQVSGKLDRAWCEAQLAALEKAGKLKVTDPNPYAPPPIFVPGPAPEEKKEKDPSGAGESGTPGKDR